MNNTAEITLRSFSDIDMIDGLEDTLVLVLFDEALAVQLALILFKEGLTIKREVMVIVETPATIQMLEIESATS